jgi:hypothetical protein
MALFFIGEVMAVFEECMIGSIGYSDIPKDPLEELFNNLKWKKINKLQLELDGSNSLEEDNELL